MNSEFSKDELISPDWLNKDFIQVALRHYKNDETILVKNIAISPGSKPGTHYASVMFKVKAIFDSVQQDLCENVIHLILKTTPVMDGIKKELLKDKTMFETEMKMYGKILPEMERLLANAGDPTFIGSRLVYQTMDPDPVIVFLDESINGFKNYERGLNLEECQVVVERIAKFHACSVFIHENGFDMSQFDKSIFAPPSHTFDFLKMYVDPAFKEMLEEINSWDGQQELCEKLKNNLPNITEKIRDLHENRDTHKYCVLTHTDFHFKNMMYRNNGLKSEDHLLVDYQCCTWNSPAADLMYFMYGIGLPEIRERHREELIYFYFNEFVKTLKKLGYVGQMPKLLDLQIDLLRFAIMEMFLLVVFAPWGFLENNVVDIDDMMENNNVFGVTKGVWKNKNFQTHVIGLFKRLIQLGALE